MRADSVARFLVTPTFQTRWERDEQAIPNFWGPLATAKHQRSEPFFEVNERLVQYFDKGRMEEDRRYDVPTSGPIVFEMAYGTIQVGDDRWQPRPAPAIPIAGDEDNAGPTYATFAAKSRTLLAQTPADPDGRTVARVATDGAVTYADEPLDSPATFRAYDADTGHNIPGVFTDYRRRAGAGATGYAISEPFSVTVRVAGVEQYVLVQLFERRVLTYTPANPSAFQVEMGNAGRQYYRWRYSPNVRVVVQGFKDGLAPVTVGDKLGFIDRTGAFAIPPQFDDSFYFGEGGPIGVIVGDRFGFVDKTGAMVIPPQFDHTFHFYEGVAPVQVGDKWGVIDPTGAFVVTPQYDYISDFSEGLAGVKKDGRAGFIDRQGRIAIPLRYDYAGLFRHGLGLIMVGDKTGYVDASGNLVVPLRTEATGGTFEDGLTSIISNNRYGYIDTMGHEAIPATYEYARPFSEGFAVVGNGGKYGFVDTKGAEAIPLQFDDAFSFTQGVAAVRMGDMWGFIDTAGKVVIPLRFEDARPFSEGLAKVQEGSKVGFIDKTGRFVVPPVFDAA